MREKSKLAGKTVKIKDGTGIKASQFVVEDWFENVVGCSWPNANGNPAALQYAVRIAKFGENNNVPPFDNDVLYGKIGMLGFLLNVREIAEE